MKARFLAEPVLVGREHELLELRRCLDSVLHGKGTTVLISGEAGSGKTRLTKEFLKTVRDEKITLLSGRCFSDVTVPYFPFMDAFDAYFSAGKVEEEHGGCQKPRTRTDLRRIEVSEDEESTIRNWLSGPKQAGGSGKLNLTPQAWKDMAFSAVTKAILSISCKKPTILFIDDLHWADSASLSLLHYIASSISSAKVMILATYRSEELGIDAEGRPHPLGETLRMMRRSDLIKEIPLINLDRDKVVALAEKMVGGRLDSELAEKLAEESRGNPLFIVESLRLMSEQGNLVQNREQWRLSVHEVGIPAKINDIILRRLGMLEPTQRRVLSLASAIGDKFDVDLLGAVLGQDSLGVLETLNGVAQSSSLIRCEASYFRFDHSRIRDAIYGEISPPLKKGYHARIAEKIEDKHAGAPDAPVNELAYHYAQAGNIEKAVKYALAAGEDFIARFTNSEAIRHFKFVLQSVAEIPKYAKEKSIALERLGDALAANDSQEEAASVFEQLANIETGSVKLRAYRKAMEATYSMRNDAQTIELAKRAEKYAAYDRLEYARIRYRIARATGLQGAVKLAGQQMEELVQVFVDEQSLSDAAHALFGAGKFSEMQGDYRKGLCAMLQSSSLLEELHDLYSQMELSSLRGPFFFRLGLFEKVKEIFEENVKIAEETGHYRRIGSAYSILSTYLEFTGNVKEATPKMQKALEYMQKTDSPRLGQYALPNLLRQYSKLGDLKKASQYYDKALKQSIKTIMSPEGNPIALWAIAVYCSATDQTEKALQLFKEILKNHLKPDSTNITALFYADFIKADYAQALTKQGRIKEAQEISQSIKKYDVDLEHVNILAGLMVPRRVHVGVQFEFRLDLVNVAKTSGILVKVENLLPSEFEATSLPSFGSMRGGSLEIQAGTISPFQVRTVKIDLKARSKGQFSLNPIIIYIDDQGQTKKCKPETLTVSVLPAPPSATPETPMSIPGRVTTGYAQLDNLLLGGIPANYAVILASSSIDERAMLVKAFLEAGANTGETTFYITDDPTTTRTLAEKYHSKIYFFICNPQAEIIVQSLPNVYKLKGVESLTEIDIALTKAFRIIGPVATGPRRICIEVLSDVLLQHHAVNTRRWLNALLPTLKSKGFTTLAVINPNMHAPEEVQAILALFDGEIRITEKETAKGAEKILQVRRLISQKYSENEITLTKKDLEH